MAVTPKIAVFDSSGLVSLVKSDDELHEKAVQIAQLLAAKGWRVVLPFEVLAESLNTIGKLVNKRSALMVGETIMEQYASQELTFAQGEPHMVSHALLLLKTATGSPSYVDCLVMAYADEHKTKYVFGFDDAFRKNNYVLPE